MNRIPDKKLKKAAMICAAGALALAVTGILKAVSLQQTSQTDYRETQAQYGDLTVGITESGSIEVGTVTQEMELDISAFSSAANSFFGQNGMQAGMSGVTGTQSSQADSRGGRALVVEQVCVVPGQQVAAGDTLFLLTQDSVDTLRNELSEDVEEAALALKQAETGRKSTELSALQRYESNIVYGEAAQTEYEETLEKAGTEYEEALSALEEAQEKASEQQAKLEELTARYEEEKHLYEEAAYLVDFIEKETDPYGYVKALESKEKAFANLEKTEEEKEQAGEDYDSLTTQIHTLTLEAQEAGKQQELATREAKALYETRMMKYQNASELYQIETGLAEEQERMAEEEYESAEAKLAGLHDAVQEYALVSEYDGIIAQIGVSEGDSLVMGTQLVTLNHSDEVSVKVSVGEEEIGRISSGSPANISVAAFDGVPYTGTVEEISEAGTDGSGNVTYEVSVGITGDGSGLYEGMSAEVTFITKETKETLYVSNRAVYREGRQSYALLQKDDGTVVRQKIRTGFSDGVNVEILEGLQEGDIVLIESKVGD